MCVIVHSFSLKPIILILQKELFRWDKTTQICVANSVCKIGINVTPRTTKKLNCFKMLLHFQTTSFLWREQHRVLMD